MFSEFETEQKNKTGNEQIFDNRDTLFDNLLKIEVEKIILAVQENIDLIRQKIQKTREAKE